MGQREVGTGSSVGFISLFDLHNLEKMESRKKKWRPGDRKGEVKCEEKRAKDKETDGKPNQRKKERDWILEMFSAICAPQIEREIAMCCWRVSVINLVSKPRDDEGERRRKRGRCLQSTQFSCIFSNYKFEKWAISVTHIPEKHSKCHKQINRTV